MKIKLPEHLQDYTSDCYGTAPFVEIIERLNAIPEGKQKEFLCFLSGQVPTDNTAIFEAILQSLDKEAKRQLAIRLINEL